MIQKVQNKSKILQLLEVSRIEVVKEQVIDADELKRVEFGRYKNQMNNQETSFASLAKS